jgi:cyanophycin synthetase
MKLRSESSQLIFDAALKKGIKAKVISKRFNLIKISCKNKSFYIKNTSFPVNSQTSCMIANNKFLTKKVFKENNLLMPKSWLVRTSGEARKLILEKKLYPCVMKPARGAHGRKVYVNINSFEEFNELIPFVFNKSNRNNVLIEEYVEGKDYRLLVVGDKVSAVMERIPAHVIGDGENNIRKLIRNFNKNPLVGEKYEKPLCKIVINGEVGRNLKKQKRKFTDIPLKNEKIFLRQNANISTGGIGKDVTDKVDQSIKDLAILAIKKIGMVVGGVDIIYNEKTKKAYLLEINDTPGIDIHHFPVLGKPRLVADDIVDYLVNNVIS